jgi:hypothetical protein
MLLLQSFFLFLCCLLIFDKIYLDSDLVGQMDLASIGWTDLQTHRWHFDH